MWVRGLKQEISINTNMSKVVAPHVGAWIETCRVELIIKFILSHPMWVRGLKHPLLSKE